MAHLEAANGPSIGTRYDLDRDQSRLGRNPSCEVLIDRGGAVSRFHAEICRRDGAFFLSDSKSRNGTFVNGEMLEGEEKLFDQDVIQICDLVFEFRDEKTKPRPKSNTIPISVVDDSAQDAEASIMSHLEISGAGSLTHVHATAETKLSAMSELLESLGKVLTVEAVLPTVVESIFKLFPQADDGVIVLGEAADDWKPEFWHSRRESAERVCVSRSIVNHVMTKQVAVVSCNALGDSRFETSETDASPIIHSFMCVSLVDSEGAAIGALQVDAFVSKDIFSEEDLELLAAVACQAAIAIGRAQLYHQSVEAQRKVSELDFARRVQLQLMPDSNPIIAGYDFFSYFQAANKIGGNYYDYFKLSDGRLVMLLTDIFGFGIAAAMQMAKLKADARFCLATIADPAEAVARLNQLLCDGDIDGRFVTMVVMILSPLDSEMVIVNAGHSSPIFKNSAGEVAILPNDNVGPLLGVVDGATYTTVTQPLSLNESLTIFTDGTFEAMKSDAEHYGEDRLAQQLAVASGSASEMGEVIVRDIDAFLRESNQKNDIFLLTLRRKP